MALLDVKNLCVDFHTDQGTVHAVRDISFSVGESEAVGIVGESGSGKSVTMYSVMGLLAGNGSITGGSVSLNGQEITESAFPDHKAYEAAMDQIRGNQMAMIFQDPMTFLNPVVKIGKQITEALILSKAIEKSKDKARAIELMEAVGIPNAAERYDAYPFQFSGGMRQRIVIAIALASNPEILICDEPTTALDVTIQARILELINDMKRERDLSVIFITHDLGVVANMADRVCVMYAGRIVEVGTCEDIFSRPAHPYTWALLSAMPDLHTEETLFAIPGAPPNMLHPPKGDAFAARNKYAMKIDFEKEPPYFKISDTHYAATWLLHPDAPKVEMPDILKHRIARMKEEAGYEIG